MSGINTLLVGVVSSATITISDVTVSASNGGAGANASYELQTDGDISQSINGSASNIGEWVVPRSAAGGNFEVFATLNSGTLSTGTTGSWLDLGSDRSWGVSQAIVGTKTAVIGLEIRRVGTTTVLDSCTVTLEAERLV